MRALIQRCLGGDQTAMLALVDCYQGQVFGLCYRMLGQRQDAEDMAQETFVARAEKPVAVGFQPGIPAVAVGHCRQSLPQLFKPPDAPAAEHFLC